MRDNPQDKDITEEEANQMAKEIKAVRYMETSSKTGEGIKELFEEAIRAAMTAETRDPCCKCM